MCAEGQHILIRLALAAPCAAGRLSAQIMRDQANLPLGKPQGREPVGQD